MATPKRKKGVANPRHPKRIAARQRHAEWVALRLQGLGPSAIAEKFGVSKGTVSEAITHYLAGLGVENAEELRAIEVARLDAIVDKLWPWLDDENAKAVNGAAANLVRVSKRRSEILGLDRPAAAPIGPDGKPAVPHITVVYEQQEPPA